MVRCGLSCRWFLVLVTTSIAGAPVAASAQPSGPADRPPAMADPAMSGPAAPQATDTAAAQDARAPDARPEHRANLGLGYIRRQFDYDVRPGLRALPPQVHSGATELQLDGEVYPFALANPTSPWKNLGFALTYDKTVGASVRAAQDGFTAMDRTVDQSYFTIGARYRLPLDARSSISFGLDYVNQQYAIEHGEFQAPITNVPDVSYSAIAPTLTGRFAVAPATTLVASINGWLAFDAGSITDLDQYGQATVYGFAAMAGAEFALTDRVNLNILFEYSRVDLTFTGDGAMSNDLDNHPESRDVNSATDESIGVVATLGLQY